MSINKSQMNGFSGLNDKEVKKSRLKYGTNAITKKRRKTFLSKYLESFGDPTIKILLVALFLNVIFFIKNFNWFESIGIVVSIILATLVSTISEYGSQLAFEKLIEDSAHSKNSVWRNGGLVEIMTEEIVVGDFVLLKPGDKIPADGVMACGSISVDQSALNGEVEEVHKESLTKINDVEIEVADKDLLNPNMIFCGSIVCDGEGVMLVQSVGDSTFYGNLASELQGESSDSPLKKRLTQLAKTISRFGYLGAALIFLSSMFNSVVIQNNFNIIQIVTYLYTPLELVQDVIKAAVMAVTIIVVAVPEGLPLMITVILSSNMKKMVRDNVLVRKLVGIEAAGSMNILFTDKTGTLTTGKLSVDTFIAGDGVEYKKVKHLKDKEKLWKWVYMSCIYNNSAQIGKEDGNTSVIGGNSTDKALFSFAYDYPIKDNVEKTYSIPFNSTNKFAATGINGDYNLTLVKGACEKIIAKCKYYYDENGNKVLLNDVFSLNRKIKEMSNNGMRMLALATSKKSVTSSDTFSDLTLVGIMGIQDEIRESTFESIKQATKAGIQVVMITGDGKDTATAIATKLGMINDENDLIMESSELNMLSDEKIKKILPKLRVVARALPSDKSRLVNISQSMGLVVGMTGDGVNDAPALKKADVGFSMGSGTEIAKEASDIIILDNNFLSITKAVLYGRTIFKSIRKFIIFQLSINVCAVGITLISQFLGIETPITIVQMLWVNIVMDTLAGLAFAGEAALPEYMEEKPKRLNEKIINKYMASQIACTGVFTTIVCIAFLKWPMIKDVFRYAPDNRYLMTGFFAFFMFAAIFNSMNARTQRLNLFSYMYKNKAFIIIMLFVLLTQMILLYFGGDVFRLYGLTAKELGVCLSYGFMVIPFDLIRKCILRKKVDKENISKFL